MENEPRGGDRQPVAAIAVVGALFFVSGATALIYEVVWLRWLVLVFGSTAFAVSTALTAFMGGLALGSWAIGRRADRVAHPLRLYATLEIGIGLCAFVVPLALEGVRAAQVALWQGLHPGPFSFALLRFVLCAAVLLVPTALMGGTLPALSHWAARFSPRFATAVGGLYGVNTVGALSGTMIGGFVLLPAIGHLASNRLAACLNISVGLIALALDRVGVTPRSLAQSASNATARKWSVIHVAVFATGFAALGLEVAWTRILVLVVGPTVYAFTLMLAAFLAGLGIGSLLITGAMARLGGSGRVWLSALAAVAAVLSFGTLHLFPRLPFLYADLFHRWGGAGNSMVPLAAAAAVSIAIMLPPTLVMGGLFPAAVAALGRSRAAAGSEVGGLYAANTAGAILGAFAAGFLMIPTVGLHRTAIAAAWIYLMVAALLSPARRRVAVFAAGAVGIVMTAAAPAWNRRLMSSGVFRQVGLLSQSSPGEALKRALLAQPKELFYEEGLVSTVAVLRSRNAYGRLGPDSVPHIYLVVNGKVDASSTGDMPTQVLSAQIPLLLHPNPRRVLVVGLASGTTAGSALRHPIERLDVVELEPAVVRASHEFDFVNGRPLDDPRTHVSVADGRTMLELPGPRWDVIISEPSNPWMTGTANLFTVEYFRLARSRLARKGIYAQWFQMYGMSSENLATLLRSFATVFPRSYLFQTIPYRDLLLIGSNAEEPIDVQGIESRMLRPEVNRDLNRVGIVSIESLLARGRWGPAELARLTARPGPLNTDDNARIEFTAPRDFYRETTGENERFLESLARGVSPYLRRDELSAWPGFLARLSKSYNDLAFYSEEVWTSRAGQSTPIQEHR